MSAECAFHGYVRIYIGSIYRINIIIITMLHLVGYWLHSSLHLPYCDWGPSRIMSFASTRSRSPAFALSLIFSSLSFRLSSFCC